MRAADRFIFEWNLLEIFLGSKFPDVSRMSGHWIRADPRRVDMEA
jgi:hypothetical protein